MCGRGRKLKVVSVAFVAFWRGGRGKVVLVGSPIGEVVFVVFKKGGRIEMLAKSLIGKVAWVMFKKGAKMERPVELDVPLVRDGIGVIVVVALLEEFEARLCVVPSTLLRSR